MQILANQVQEYKGDFADFGYSRNDSNGKVSFEINQSSPSLTFASPGPFSPLLPIKRNFRKRLSFSKFPLQPIRLSVLKLDGSSFDIIVTKKATVAKLKQAVEAAFSHLPRQGDGKVSWSHVWGQFCLSFEGQKLLRDRDSIGLYGIQSGDQLRFVRHTSISNLARERSEKLDYDSDESDGSPSKSDLYEDMKKKGRNNRSNQQNLFQNEDDEGYGDVGAHTKCHISWARVMRGLFSYRTLEGPTKGNNRVMNSLARVGRSYPHDDANINGRRDLSYRMITGSNRYICASSNSPNSFSGFTGSFGYPTGYSRN